MKRLLALLLIFFMAGTSQAQTATPTTSPVIHYQGDYWFFYDPDITWSGTWTQPANGYTNSYTTSSSTAYGAFTVSDSICWISIDYISTSTAFPALLINGVTHNGPLGGTGPVPWVFDLRGIAAGDFVIQISRGGAGTLNLYKMQLLTCGTPFPTATILPSSTPFIPVPTATILPSSTPFEPVPTATVVPTATPPDTPVPTATILPSSTPADMQPTIDALLTLIAGGGGCGCGPTDTPTITNTPTETTTPSPEPWVYLTVTSGQLTRFDYTASASDVHIGNILTALVFSLWGMFLFAVFVLWRSRR
jgi:hypothetical protein